MDSFELNKIAGALLGTVLLVFGLQTIAGGIFSPHLPEKPGLEVEVAEADAAGDAGGEVEEETPFAVLLASADVGKGESVAKKCASCHTFEQGGANKVGPALYGVLNRPKGAVDGFNYSEAMQTVAAEGQVWGYDEMNGFLADPKGYLKGTSMSFAGLRKPDDRADIVAYLRTLDANPAPLPEVPTEAPATEGATGEGAATEGQVMPAETMPASDAGSSSADTMPASGEGAASGGDTMTTETAPAESETMPAPAEEQPAAGSSTQN